MYKSARASEGSLSVQNECTATDGVEKNYHYSDDK